MFIAGATTRNGFALVPGNRRREQAGVEVCRRACRLRVTAISTTFFGTNVKMHQTARESAAYLAQLATLPHRSELQFFAIVPFTSLAASVERARGSGVWVGAQNVHWAAAGEYTGEIAAPMLADLGVDLVLVGHAERRHVFGEDDLLIRRKVQAALEADLRVLLCVGETADERRFGAGAESVARQLKIALHGVATDPRIMIAYEPVWAIGEAGAAADVSTVAETAAAIRAVAGALPLLYGGSVSAASAAGYAGVTGIDGLFVGRAARPAAGFAAVARAAYPKLLTEYVHAAVHEPHEKGSVEIDE